LSRLYLFRKSHEKHVWAVGDPFIAQLVFGLVADIVVGRLQSLQELRKNALGFCW
jgi:hypothetical protein